MELQQFTRQESTTPLGTKPDVILHPNDGEVALEWRCLQIESVKIEVGVPFFLKTGFDSM